MPLATAVRIPAWAASARFGAVAALIVLTALTAALAPLLGEGELVAVAMLFLLVVLLASAAWGYVAGLLAAILADVLLNVFFVPPLHTVTVQQPSNVAALCVFLAVAVIGASMLALLRRQLAIAQDRRSELTIMLGLSRELAAAPNPERALEALARSIVRAVGGQRADIFRKANERWTLIASTAEGRATALSRDDAALAQSALDSGTLARRLSGGPRRSSSLRPNQHQIGDTFVPFRSEGSGDAGIIRIEGNIAAPHGGDLDALLRAFADEAGVAIHHALLAEQARQTEALQRSDEFKSVLLSSVSHDLRSPLTAIKAAVGSLRSDEVPWSDADRGQFLETIESQTDRLTGTVTHLLEMSRLEGGAVRPTLESIEVQPLLEEVRHATVATTAGRTLRVDATRGSWVRADYGLLLQALTSLVENAAKYSVPGGAIRLRDGSIGGRVIIEVADEGPGIAADDLPHIFDKFYRGKTAKAVTGTGLGLAIVRAMVELCGGRVSVESSPAGAVFRLSLTPVGPPR
ncbi:hypothetical protein AYO38_07955 [bacterium SCGC AG-212-C10]|nr:hypothetical protein AYO38_07955 [bacterium SCGC AG-212-C10]